MAENKDDKNKGNDTPPTPPPGDPTPTKTVAAKPQKTFRNISTSTIELDYGKESFRVLPGKTIQLTQDQVDHHAYGAVANILREIVETKKEEKK